MEDFDQGRYITPLRSTSIYPTFDDAQKRVLYAGELDDGSYDLFALDLASGGSTPLLQTEDASEFASSVAPDGVAVLIRATCPRQVFANCSVRY